MGVFTERLRREVRLEYLRPEEAQAAKHEQPAIYVPFGSIEWHGYHNVVGLDTLKAHEQLVGLAESVGGVVYPPVYFGAGGGHGDWPSSFMVSAEPMIVLVNDLLRGFEKDGYRKAVLLSGHYPNRFDYLDAAVARYRESGGKMQVLALIENQAPGVGGDHAATFETSYMLYLHPATVDMRRLQADSPGDSGPSDELQNWMDKKYERHPCYGLVGVDPRGHASAEVGRENTDRLLDFLRQWVRGESPKPVHA